MYIIRLCRDTLKRSAKDLYTTRNAGSVKATMEHRTEAMNTNHDELSYYMSQGLAVRVDGITISNRNLEHVNLILKEDDSYMKEFIGDQRGEICAVDYRKIQE